jgi:hypothetical protein
MGSDESGRARVKVGPAALTPDKACTERFSVRSPLLITLTQAGSVTKLSLSAAPAAFAAGRAVPQQSVLLIGQDSGWAIG